MTINQEFLKDYIESKAKTLIIDIKNNWKKYDLLELSVKAGELNSYVNINETFDLKIKELENIELHNSIKKCNCDII